MNPPQFSQHALDRFAERFPGLDPWETLGRAVRLNKLKVARLAGQNRGREGKFLRVKAGTTYLRDPETGATFLVEPVRSNPADRIIATVIPLLDREKERKR